MLCVVCRFEPAEHAADCLNNPCLITLSRNSWPDKSFKGRLRGERDLGLSCSTATPSPQLATGEFAARCVAVIGEPNQACVVPQHPWF